LMMVWMEVWNKLMVVGFKLTEIRKRWMLPLVFDNCYLLFLILQCLRFCYYSFIMLRVPMWSNNTGELHIIHSDSEDQCLIVSISDMLFGAFVIWLSRTKNRVTQELCMFLCFHCECSYITTVLDISFARFSPSFSIVLYIFVCSVGERKSNHN
jgi:hypothetical protein